MKLFKKNLIEESKRFLKQAKQSAYTAPVKSLFIEMLHKFNDQKWCDSLILSERNMAAEFNIPKSTVHAATKFLIERGHLFRTFDRGLCVWSLEPIAPKNQQTLPNGIEPKNQQTPPNSNAKFFEKTSITEGQPVCDHFMTTSSQQIALSRDFSPPNHNRNYFNEDDGIAGKTQVVTIQDTIPNITDNAQKDLNSCPQYDGGSSTQLVSEKDGDSSTRKTNGDSVTLSIDPYTSKATVSPVNPCYQDTKTPTEKVVISSDSKATVPPVNSCSSIHETPPANESTATKEPATVNETEEPNHQSDYADNELHLTMEDCLPRTNRTSKNGWISAADYYYAMTSMTKPPSDTNADEPEYDEHKRKEFFWNWLQHNMNINDRKIFAQCEAVIGLKKMKELFMRYNIKNPVLYFLRVALDYQKREEDKTKRAEQIKDSDNNFNIVGHKGKPLDKPRRRPDPNNLNNLFYYYSDKQPAGNWLPKVTKFNEKQVAEARALVERRYPEYSFDDDIIRACVRFRNSRPNMKLDTLVAKIRHMQRLRNDDLGISVLESQEDSTICADGVSAVEVRRALEAIEFAQLSVDDFPKNTILEIIIKARKDPLIIGTRKFAEKFYEALLELGGVRGQGTSSADIDCASVTIDVPNELLDMHMPDDMISSNIERENELAKLDAKLEFETAAQVEETAAQVEESHAQSTETNTSIAVVENSALITAQVKKLIDPYTNLVKMKRVESIEPSEIQIMKNTCEQIFDSCTPEERRTIPGTEYSSAACKCATFLLKKYCGGIDCIDPDIVQYNLTCFKYRIFEEPENFLRHVQLHQESRVESNEQQTLLLESPRKLLESFR